VPAAPLPRKRGSELHGGLPLLPAQRLAVFAPDQLEIVVGYWLNEVVRPKYARIYRYGQSGDKGRDVAGYVSDDSQTPWDNYQCKRYAKSLAPSDLWADIGKLVYWVTEGTYEAPREYTFVSPKGAGAKAAEVLDDAERVRAGLIENWTRYCGGLCSLAEIQESIETFSFPNFRIASGDQIAGDLKNSAVYPALFGGGLTKPRPANQIPPDEIATHELPYIDCLIEAYEDHCHTEVGSADQAREHPMYGAHLVESRRDFYCAESLREFSKDVLIDPDEYVSLQEVVFDGVKYIHAQSFPSGYERVLAVCAQSAAVQVGDHPLGGELTPADRSGICHQLANDGRWRWKG
jgi:hypothetical protein